MMPDIRTPEKGTPSAPELNSKEILERHLMTTQIAIGDDGIIPESPFGLEDYWIIFAGSRWIWVRVPDPLSALDEAPRG